VLAAACTQGGGIVEASPVEQACDGYVDTVVSRHRACGQTFDPSTMLEDPWRAAACKSLASAPGSGFSKGWLDDCIARLKAAPCHRLERVEAECESPTGTVAVGAGCLDGSQCQSGACLKSERPPQGTIDCGVCGAALPEGAPCPIEKSYGRNVQPDCEPGLTCLGPLPPPSTGTCTRIPTVQEGEPCGTQVDPKTGRLSLSQCAEGLVCEEPDSSSSPRVCKTLPQAGERCADRIVCAEGLACRNASTREAVCEPPIPEGGACTFGGCSPGTMCSPPGGDFPTCLRVTFGAPGDACDERANHFCDQGRCGAHGICPPVAAGEQPCTTWYGCSPYRQCIDGRCQLPDPKACK
jgi:hypothetical protein